MITIRGECSSDLDHAYAFFLFVTKCVIDGLAFPTYNVIRSIT